MTRVRFRTPAADCVIEPRTLADGACMACVLLADSDHCAAVQVVNLTDRECRLEGGQPIGMASAGRVVGGPVG